MMTADVRAPARRRIGRLLGIQTGILLAILVVFELLARCYDWTPRARDLSPGDKLGMSRYNYSAAGFGDLVPEQDGHWITWHRRPFHVQTNGVGLRNTEEPSDTAFRILAVGDSQTFGVFLANGDTWPTWTENFLRRREQSDPVQVFNAGIIGYTIVDELSYLKDKGVAFKPRLVVLGVFENDLRDMRKVRGGTKNRPASTSGVPVTNFFQTLGRNLALVQLINAAKDRAKHAAAGVDIRADRLLQGAGWAPPTGDEEALAASYADAFRELEELLKAHAIGLAVIFIPALESMDPKNASILEPRIRALAAANSTPYLDFTPLFRAEVEPVSRLYLAQQGPSGAPFGDGHLSREGASLIGRTLAAWLKERGLVQ
jgi:lysophospholipase L1-like esterase